MPKSSASCIPVKPGSFFLMLRHDYVHMLNGDHASAAVLGCLEYFTNKEMDVTEKYDEDVWIPVRMVSFLDHTTGLLSERTIRDRVEILKQHGLIEVESLHIGSIKRYKLNRQVIIDHLDKRTRLTSIGKFADGEIESPSAAPSAAPSVVFADGGADGRGVLNLKEVERELETEQTPIVPKQLSQTNTSELDLDDHVDKFVANAYRRENRRAKLEKLTTKSSAFLVDRIRKLELSVGVEDFRRGLLGFLRDQSDWCRENQWPIAAYLKNPERWVAAYVAPVPAEADPTRPAILEGVGATSVPPAPPRLVVADLIAKWNSVIPSSPVDAWDDRLDLTPGVRRSLEDPKFAECFDIVCQKVAAIKADRDDAGWLTFRWLFTQKDGKPFGWWRVRCGDMDWKPRQSAAESSMNSGMAYAARLRAEIALEKKQRESHT